ncbi:MAG: type II toxin-antitoxin system RelE/ParE family toxin [bacterium]|nr:type II toxin-antitoxin system RelE/ParE family toxin [bacterium]
MEIITTPEFEALFSDLPKIIKKKAIKQTKLFCGNPFYNSLNTEKIEPRNKQVWSFRVDKNYRIIFKFLENKRVVFLAMGPHKWIYRLDF